MSIREREERLPECPECDSGEVEPVLSAFYAQTESKS